MKEKKEHQKKVLTKRKRQKGKHFFLYSAVPEVIQFDYYKFTNARFYITSQGLKLIK